MNYLSKLTAAGLIAMLTQSTHAAEQGALKDKTLVVWVAPANFTQRGGSALTIDNNRGRFDGIVFGEIAPGKWMAGSDTFLRTERNQAAFPAETSDAKTFVQMAMVYEGTQVTAFRNGVQYSQHAIGAPQSFGVRSAVVIGKRHLTQNGMEHFGGTIDDARIFDRALSAEQIAALKPNLESDIKPWAWWTFDDKEAKDRTGRFEITEITGGAKVQDGKLVLDGVTGEFLAKTDKAPEPHELETPAWPENPPPNWLTFHLAHPCPGDAVPGDPNCAFFWKGRYHLHYIYRNEDGFVFAHVSSTDLVHWKWHPTTLAPSLTGHGMFSGTGFITKDGKPAIIYHGEGSGRNQLAFALDDNLEKWTRPVPINPLDAAGKEPQMRHWDPDCWLNGDTYYALSGGQNPQLMKSSDLKNWTYLGPLLHDGFPANLGVRKGEDISCANMFKIGNKWMLLCISHDLGCRYYLGDFKDEKYLPDLHAMMSWNGNAFFAPESLLTADGRRVMWAWLIDAPIGNSGARLPLAPRGVQSLPRELSLPADGVLRIKPLRELEALRHDEKLRRDLVVRSDVPTRLEDISGDALELKLTIEPGKATEVCVEVLCDRDGKGGTRVVIDTANKVLQVGDVKAPFELKDGEQAELRVFIDKNLIEAFVNERQAAVTAQKLVPGNEGVQLVSKGGDAVVKELWSWRMKSVFTKK